MTKINKTDYLAKARQLTKEETERLLSRMGTKLDRRLEKRKVTQEEALAKQLEWEDEQLQEWRKNLKALKEQEKEKEEKKAKKEARVKIVKIAKAVKKTSAPLKAKSAVKP